MTPIHRDGEGAAVGGEVGVDLHITAAEVGMVGVEEYVAALRGYAPLSRISFPR